jgi:hypothetical protein
MAYTKITLEVVVETDDVEEYEQALIDAMEKVEEHVTVYDSSIVTAETGEPANAAEIAAPVEP